MRLRRALAAASALLGLTAWGYANETARPLVREARFSLPGWPAGSAPVRLVLLSDIHVQGPDMPPERLARVVAEVNGLRPDIIVVAGDFVSEKWLATRSYSAAEAVAPLRALRPRLGTVAVLGNHDTPGVAAALRATGIRLLRDDVAAVGPLAIGGMTGEAPTQAMLKALRALPGARIAVEHAPDGFATLPPDIPLMLAGHTHCGQIAIPGITLPLIRHFHKGYGCGLVRRGSQALIVTGGLGTSHVPLRYFAPPEVWLVTLGGRST